VSTIPTRPHTSPAPVALRAGLWIAQVILAATFVGGGVWKLLTPVAEVAEAFPWAGETPTVLLHTTAVLDVFGGLGVLLPSLTRIRPGLAVLAALGCGALQLSAIVFHVVRGEGTEVGINVALLALALFVAWGRGRRAPVPART
jgi:uncharacterized membrane protein YphA (DoxX/SURF4 family)